MLTGGDRPGSRPRATKPAYIALTQWIQVFTILRLRVRAFGCLLRPASAWKPTARPEVILAGRFFCEEASCGDRLE